MKNIAFFDIEVNVNSKKIEKLGLVINDEKISTSSVGKVCEIFKNEKPNFICGHNFINHDKKFLSNTSFAPYLQNCPIIDTLYLSMILHVNKKTHKLDKPYKTEINIENQPLGDAKQTKELFKLLDKEFDALEQNLKDIFISLLWDSEYLKGYFEYKKFKKQEVDIYEFIKQKIVCEKGVLNFFKNNNNEELAFVISYLSFDDEASISNVILHLYPKIVPMLKTICFDESKIDIEKFAKNEFDFSSFKFNTFKRQNINLLVSNEISQEEIIKTALKEHSLLAILPTGGGKTFTFQLPALLKAQAYKGLSVVISPLQALMKNHVDSFSTKNQNFNIKAISGYLNPIERANILEEVKNGSVDVLYLAPESLRSETIFSALKKRIIERFIIDEAHCFSSWGHDFRHDYYFIADTIQELQTSSYQPKIAVSCFTATAKPEVISDIKDYFKTKLDITLKEFIASTDRYNLEYYAIEVENPKQKYDLLVNELYKQGKIPTIIYIPQNASLCKKLSEELQADERLFELGLEIEPFYAKIDKHIENGKRKGRNKAEILNDFIANKIDIVVATTAFGMGIDKPDIKSIIHYEQSDSLESYLQESGRGARDKNIKARCLAIYCKSDFDKSFAALNHSKVELEEIKRIVRELKKIKNRNDIYLSPKDLAEKMGIDTEDSKIDYEVVIKTALLELEKANIIKRGRNSYKIFATAIKEKKRMQAVHESLDCKKDELNAKYEYEIYSYMITLMQNLIQKSKDEEVIEVDNLSDIVGIERKKIFDVLYELQKANLLSYENDISIFVKKSVRDDLQKHFKLENTILQYMEDLPKYENTLDLRQINQNATNNNIKLYKKIIQSWSNLSRLKLNIFSAYFMGDICKFELQDRDFKKLKKMLIVRQATCKFIIEEILKNLLDNEAEVEICSNELKITCDTLLAKMLNRKMEMAMEGFHHSLVYLHAVLKDSFNLKKGRLIYYQAYKLQKQEKITEHTPYNAQNYKESLKPYYERKIKAIHIQMSFLQRLLKDGWKEASKFVKDYFSLDYKSFRKKYGFDEDKISLPITQEKLNEILQNLNDEQKAIFNDTKHSSILVLAGPGSGKTKILVHKIASMITRQNQKSEYFLMLAHSRVAVNEFKSRLFYLLGNTAKDMKIYTFHTFAIKLLGKKGDEQILKDVIKTATKLLREDKIQLPLTQMLVLDEYQDVGKDTYGFIKAIYEKMSYGKKIIAVGDDDQCINDFGDNKADIKFIQKFKEDFNDFDEEDEFVGKTNFKEYSLLNNYRSDKNIIKLLNAYSEILPNRLKIKPLQCISKDDGFTELIVYHDTSYMQNLLDKIKQDKSKNIAVLARNNDEVLSIYSLLKNEGLNVKYITSQDGFRLGNLEELQDFLSFWQKDELEKAREKYEKIYKNSSNFILANSVIERFLEQEPNIQYRVFESFLSQIEFEEFEHTKADIIVSTMHKSKGKEFESVHMCVGENFIKNDYDKRLLFVALSRAKNSLIIHTKDNIFDFLNPYFNAKSNFRKKCEEPKRVTFLMRLGDVALSNPQSQMGISLSNPKAGDLVEIFETHLGIIIQKHGYQIAKLSKKITGNENRLSNKIYNFQQKGYRLEKNAKVDYIVHWKNKDDDKIYKQVLCQIYMVRV